MKKFNLIPTLVGLSTIPAVIVPITSCSCTITKVLDLENVTIGQTNLFGINKSNYNQGTIYDYRMKLTNWTTDFSKPKESEWTTVTSFKFVIEKDDSSNLKLKNTDKIKLMCDGKELTRGNSGEVKLGTKDWAYSGDEVNDSTHMFWINNKNGTTFSYTSTLILEGIDFDSDASNVNVAFAVDK